MAKEKVCLAYSGGLDTSCILAWLIEKNYAVVCFMADVGQEEDFEAAKQKAMKIGAENVYVVDLKREFVEELCFPAVQCNAIYENVYLLGTSLARPVIARAQIDVAKKEGCVAVSHGCTGKKLNRQPKIKVIAPWRMPEFYNRFKGRNDLLDYADKIGVPVTSTKSKPWSMDENLAHCSYEAGILEDPDTTPPTDMWKLTADPISQAPNEPEDFILHFENGIPVKLEFKENGKSKIVTDSVELFLTMNGIARKHGVGRIDIVSTNEIDVRKELLIEQSAGLTCLRAAHVDLEGLVMDREVRALRDQFVTVSYSRILYNGFYFSPECKFLQSSITASQDGVNGQVRCRVYKGSVSILGRSSETAKLYDTSESSMDEIGDFEPEDTTGYIKVQAIRLKKYGQQEYEKAT
ncbi:MAG: hypothetical protein Q9164_000544 [Protoblastenia rupestris]